jgi:formylglycine-generating enzyme required for sulfatase activity
MKTTIRQWYSVFFLFIAMLLCNNCRSPFDHDDPQQKDDAGQGTIHLIISNPLDTASSARTIFPDTPVFSSYRLSFTPLSGQDAKVDIVIPVSGETTIKDIDLDVGNWKITVYGRALVNGQEKEVAEGSNDNVEVIANEDIVVSVTLYSKSPDGGTGTFAYSITVPQGIVADSYSIVLSEWNNNTNRVFNINESIDVSTTDFVITSSASELEQIHSGYYLLEFSIGTGRQKVFYTDIIHILTDRTSRFERIISSGDFVPVVMLSGTVHAIININGTSGIANINEVLAYFSDDEQIGYATVDNNTWLMTIVEMSELTDIFFRIRIEIPGDIIEVKSDVMRQVSNSDISDIDININFSAITLRGTINSAYFPDGITDKANWKVMAYTDPENIPGSSINAIPEKTDSSGAWKMTVPAFDVSTDVYFSIEDASGKYKRVNLNKTSLYNTNKSDISITGYFTPPKQIWIRGTLPGMNNETVSKTMIKSNDGKKFAYTHFGLEDTFYAINFLTYFAEPIASPNWNGLNDAIWKYDYNNIIIAGTKPNSYQPGDNNQIKWWNTDETLKFTLDFSGDDYFLTGTPHLSIERQTEKRNEILIPGGTFTMGSPAGEEGRLGPSGLSSEIQHLVTISPMYMMNSEVTQKMYEELLMPVPAYPAGFRNENYPVVNISWLDACEFANRLSDRDGRARVYTISGTTVTANWNANGWRLPTEAEWEYAARAGSTTPFAILGNFSNTLNTAMANYNGSAGIIAVRSFEPNAFGLYDMHGNVWEYCWDWYGEYPTAAVTDPKGNAHVTGDNGDHHADNPPPNGVRIIRGGSYYCSSRYLRSAHRGVISPTIASNNDIGFRLVRNAQ